jgi:hypothetical protein
MIEDFIFREELEAAPWTPDLADPEAVHRLWEPEEYAAAELVRLQRPGRIALAYRAKAGPPKILPYGPTGYRVEQHLGVGGFFSEAVRLIPIGPGEMAFDMVIDPACPPDRVYMVPKDWGLGGRSWL